MNYSKKSFVVATPGTADYADRWEKTFRGTPYGNETTTAPSQPVVLCANCSSPMAMEPDGQVFCAKRCFLAST